MAEFGPAGLVGLIVYGSGPKPVNVYLPDESVKTGPTGGEPTVLATLTLGMGRGAGGFPIAFP